MRDQTDNVEMVLADRAWPMQILKCLYISGSTQSGKM